MRDLSTSVRVCFAVIATIVALPVVVFLLWVASLLFGVN